MTTSDILPFEENKHSYFYYVHLKEIIHLKGEVTYLQHQVDSLQKSIANLRKDLSISKTESSTKDRTFWIHW